MLIHDLMNRLTTLSRRLPATFLALAATAGFRADAQITLSGAAMFAAGPDGTPGAGGTEASGTRSVPGPPILTTSTFSRERREHPCS